MRAPHYNACRSARVGREGVGLSYDKTEDDDPEGESAQPPPGDLPPGWEQRSVAGPKATPGPRYSPRRSTDPVAPLPEVGSPLPPPRGRIRAWVWVAAGILVAALVGFGIRAVLPDAGTVGDAPTAPVAGGDLGVGDSVEGVVDGGAVRFAVSLARDQRVRIDVRATSDGFDPFLSVYGPDAYLIGANDDAEAGTLDSRLVVLPQVDGVHEVEVRGWFVTEGSFTLTVTAA